MNCPLVSVVIPVYNTCSYLDKMFDCLLKQTYQNWEAICIDDESADSSFDKLQEYADRDSRLHVIKNEHSGVSETRNLGISMANGEYIFFFDSDDVFEPNLIEDCISFACQKNVDTVIYGYGGISEGGGIPNRISLLCHEKFIEMTR